MSISDDYFFEFYFPNVHAYSCRCIQTLGRLYWSPWTTKACGTWGLQYGKGSTLGNNSISGSGLRFTALLMNMTFLLMLYVVAKPLDNINRTDYIYFKCSLFSLFLLPVMRGWLQDKTFREEEKIEGYFYVCLINFLDGFFFACMIMCQLQKFGYILVWNFVVR